MTFAETEKTELKQKLTDSIPKEIVAFLNTHGGTIYIGVNDDGSVCGIEKLDDSLKKIVDMIESQILPETFPSTLNNLTFQFCLLKKDFL